MTVCVIDECQEPGNTVTLGQIPGAPSLSLCSQHSWDLFWWEREKSRKIATAISEANPEMDHTPGWTYVIRLANGNVKIGTSNQPKMKRLKDLSGKPNQSIPVQVLALMKGGESLEAVLQQRLGHLRVQGAMEEFWPDPSLLQWASEQGIDPAVSDFDDWLVSNKQKPSGLGEYAQKMLNHIGDGPMPFRTPSPAAEKFLTDKMSDQGTSPVTGGDNEW